jgi:hypothetical protein
MVLSGKSKIYIVKLRTNHLVMEKIHLQVYENQQNWSFAQIILSDSFAGQRVFNANPMVCLG